MFCLLRCQIGRNPALIDPFSDDDDSDDSDDEDESEMESDDDDALPDREDQGGKFEGAVGNFCTAYVRPFVCASAVFWPK